jgi:predicted amidohydrolase
MRVGSANLGNGVRAERSVGYRLSAREALGEVERILDQLASTVHDAGRRGCDVLLLPEECLGLSSWEVAHRESLQEVLPAATDRMITRLGGAAAGYSMYLVCCNDTLGPGGEVRNTAILLDPRGAEIGRYHKVGLPIHEQHKRAGEGFPVYTTPDLGGVGMLICYDMVFPEPMRCLSLAGASIVFVPTEGGAAFGDAELSRNAFRVRAAENFTYLVVSWGGWGDDTPSMVISPKGEVLAEQFVGGRLAIADLDPGGGREWEGWSNSQRDMRAKLFRERRPAAYSLLVEDEPPVLASLPPMDPGPPEEIIRIADRAITVGHEEYGRAEELARQGLVPEAAKAYEALAADYPGTWFERRAHEALASLEEERR